MRFYTQQHYYCGIDLHARSMYICILNQDGEVVVHSNIPTRPGPFLGAIAPYRDDIAVAVECIFTWYWLADPCHREGITFVLGHALYMKAIHGGKAKALSILAHKLGQAVYYMLLREKALEMNKFLAARRDGAAKPDV